MEAAVDRTASFPLSHPSCPLTDILREHAFPDPPPLSFTAALVLALAGWHSDENTGYAVRKALLSTGGGEWKHAGVEHLTGAHQQNRWAEMAEGLPEGLITHNDTIAGEINRLHEVDVEDIIRMWQVYAASKAILPNGVGQRLANFLWRVWGSEKILHNLSGAQLAAHFNAISEDGPLRTTPTQSPRTSRNLSLPSSTSRAQPQLLPPPSDEEDEEADVLEAGSSTPRQTSPQQEQDRRDTRLPSILKKPTKNSPPDTAYASRLSTSQAADTQDDRHESASSAMPRHGTTKARQKDRSTRSAKKPPVLRRSTERADSETLPPSSEGSSSTLNSASSEDTIKPPSGAAPKAKRTKTVFHAGARKRPVAMKRKASQTSSSTATSTTSPCPPTTANSLSGTPNVAAESMRSLQDPTMPPTRRANAPPKSEKTDEAIDASPEPPATEFGSQSRRSPIVEPDFRSKFVEKTRSAQSSFVNLPSLLRKPSTTTATSASQAQAHPAGKSRGKVTFTEGSKPPGPAGPDIGNDEEPQELPRTKSQLTLLLEKDRRAGGRGQGRSGS